AFVALFAWRGVLTMREAVIAAALVVTSAAATIVLAMVFNGAGLSQAVCDAVLRRGGAEMFCGHQGAFVWLDRDMAYGASFTWQANVASGIWPWFVVGYMLAMLPFGFFRVADDPTGRRTAWALAAVLFGVEIGRAQL